MDKKILIIGAGLLGVTSAYYLARLGYKVQVIDRREDVARECSYANAAQLSYSDIIPWATSEVWRKIPSLLFSYKSPLIIHVPGELAMWSWIFNFFKHCNNRSMYQTMTDMIDLSLHSKSCMEQFLQEHDVDFDYRNSGILHIFNHVRDFNDALEQRDFLEKRGFTYQVLKKEECILREPTLDKAKIDIVGGIVHNEDALGDSFRFCKYMRSVLENQYGVKFSFHTEMQRFLIEGNKIAGIDTNFGIVSADEYLLAAGAFSTPLISQLGITIPVYPMKGYSLTIPYQDKDVRINHSIMDHDHKIVYTTLGNYVRIAGTAELCGYDFSIYRQRIMSIIDSASKILEDVLNPNNFHPIERWSCLRPATPSGKPIISRTRYENLTLNTGHGTLGWTLAMGSGNIAAKIINGEKCDLDIETFAL